MNSDDKTRAITQATSAILRELPTGVTLVAAAKTRMPEEVLAAIGAGVSHVGHNYIQEAEKMISIIGDKAKWHFIGHLQKNKVKKAVRLFDIIETIDSIAIAVRVDRECAAIGKVLPVLIEVNSGREETKAGVLPEDLDNLITQLMPLKYIHVEGLMTMGPRFGNPEDARPYFRATKQAFDRISRADIPNIELLFLSMGMSNSYKVAIQEGANVVRIGTRLFGERPPKFTRIA